MGQARATTGRERLRELAHNLPALLAGRHQGGTAETRIREATLRAGAVELLRLVQEAFIAKARGGTGSDGITWKPLDPKTVAYHRRHPGLTGIRGRAARQGRAGRPLLTDAQDQLWRRVYAQTLARHGDAGRAAGAAWAAVKAAGGKTILAEYGGVQVEIGRDTGRLLNSLSAGSPDGILEIVRNAVVVGTNVRYAGAFHARRPLWPERMPEAWQEAVAEAMVKALMLALAQEMRP